MLMYLILSKKIMFRNTGDFLDTSNTCSKQTHWRQARQNHSSCVLKILGNFERLAHVFILENSVPILSTGMGHMKTPVFREMGKRPE